MIWFDVCNDYSLSVREEQPADLSQYRKIEGEGGLNHYYHKEYGELHYAHGPLTAALHHYEVNDAPESVTSTLDN